MSVEVLEEYSVETRTRNDLETLFAEVLNGEMCTRFEYHYDEARDKLIAEDDSDLGKIFKDSLDDIKHKATKNPNLSFEVRRREHELAEFEDMKAMMCGNLPNTMVAVSDFPAELMDYPSDYIGYNVVRKPTMLRVLHRDGNRLVMFTQSLDGSNRQALEKIYQHLGFVPHDGEMLGQRMNFEIQDTSALMLVNKLTDVFDSQLESQTGKKHRAGREVRVGERLINTYDFVRAQQDIISLALQESSEDRFGEEREYETAALLVRRYEQYKFGASEKDSVIYRPPVHSAADVAINFVMLNNERFMAGNSARSEGRTFSSCGMTMSSSLSAKEQLEASGYGVESEGSNDDSEESWSYDRKAYCRACQAPPGKDEKKKLCGPCNICKDCVDTKFGGKK